jgi:hypothetical protein
MGTTPGWRRRRRRRDLNGSIVIVRLTSWRVWKGLTERYGLPIYP